MARVFSVGQVNTYIRRMFEQDFVLSQISVTGEVSNCKYHTSGHIYFSLKDSTGNLSCVMFAGNRRTGLNFQLQNGQQVVVSGQISVYERDGKYQLYARKIEPQGRGALYEQFLKIRQELEDMGMFAPEYKQPIPRFARRIGIVTAPTGAAIRDIIQISRRRNPYVQLILYPAIVQGVYAVDSICQGIRTLDDMGLDVIIVGRGGGSLEELWAFNEEAIARTIFACQTPVISAVGHETDFTIADFVADLRAPTPSAAAELAVFEIGAVEEYLSLERRKLKEGMRSALERSRQKTAHAEARLAGNSPRSMLREKRLILDACQDKMKERILQKLQMTRGETQIMEQKLKESMQAELLENRHRLALSLERMKGLSPLEKLNQGFAVAENKEKKRISSVSSVEVGEPIAIFVSDGTLYAQVTDKKEYRIMDMRGMQTK